MAPDHRHKSDFIKVAIYNGKSSWKDYLVQFDLAAHANSWDKDTKVIKFACSLRGSAQALLSDMGPDVRGVVGWCDGPGELPVPGRLTSLDKSRARAYCSCSRCGWGLFGHFYSRLSFLCSFSLSLGDDPI